MQTNALDGLRDVPADADGGRAAVVDLERRRGAELYGFARRLGMTPEAAEDAVQETLLRTWSALDRGTDIRELDAWAFRALYRVCMDEHRWRRRARRLAERLRPTGTPRADAGAPATVADRLTLWEAVDRLPERQRTVLHLRYRADLTFDQIGAVLDIKPVSARSHVSRGLDRLAAMLGEETFR